MSYKTKLDAGQGSISTINVVKNGENFPTIKDRIGDLIIDSLEKAKSLDPFLCVSTQMRN